MRLPALPQEATRFFARVSSAVMECPRCGRVLRFASPSRAYRAINPVGRPRGTREREAASTRLWNPHTCRLKCQECDLVLMIGLIAWPVSRSGGQAGTLPRDQVPNERQLGQLRAEAGGWWMPEKMRKKPHRPDDTNITARCSCEPGKENTTGQDPGCPIHGEGV